ncbi:uncharacterized protein LOC116415793 [Nasonia vitripennis]|uniref:Uncharacterized protein n=1 Tax=Nasonia vitripennis TaxID=7425 RepID=A0A7M7PV08_NASVI|nr:uncharacterized protein LOC116415793 [Nasonia vitripennis]
MRKVLNGVDNNEDTNKVDKQNDEDVICIDSDESNDEQVEGNCKDSNENEWPVEALDEYIEILLNKEPITHPANHLIKKEEIPEAHMHVTKNRMQEIPMKKIEVQQHINKRLHEHPIKRDIDKEDILPLKKVKTESGEEQRKNFDFPKKPTFQKDTAESSIEQIIKSISDKFHDRKKNDSLCAKARVICTHLLTVKEQYRNKCFFEISIHLDQYKK